MSEAEGRTPLVHSLSFSSTPSSPLARPPKRRISSSSDLQFFTPAASSFKPRPYTPNADSHQKIVSRSHSRNQDALGVPPLGMDPQPSDPNVVFVHPPFDVFPDSHFHPVGLTYSLMADNPEWFLDSTDFISPNNSNPHAIPYPPHLEPPRGWCPAKKKDLKERGTEGWPEGEEPRLRCTFCRRTYAGVNAKSMWRRHVFEKHKIAMSNRRDGSDRPRGRGSNKENRRVSSAKAQDDIRLVDLNHTENRNLSVKSKFGEAPHRSKGKYKDDAATSVDDSDHAEHPLSESYANIDCALLTSHSRTQVTVVNDALPIDASELTCPASPPMTLPVVPPSPYDPLLTPSFRHSSPRRPSEQPWRFPSPSHPLHSRSQDLSLSLLIRGMHSPMIKRSPAVGENTKAAGASPFTSPTVFGKGTRLGMLDLGSPAKSLKHSPTSIFCKGRIQLSSDRMSKLRTVQESPLNPNNKRAISDLNVDWLADVPSSIMSGNDPFASIWNTVGDGCGVDKENKPLQCNDALSPVLRSARALPSDMGLGIGLLDPFTLSEDGGAPSSIDSDFDGVSLYPPAKGDTDDQPSDKESQSTTTSCKSTPPAKRRRTNVD